MFIFEAFSGVILTFGSLKEYMPLHSVNGPSGVPGIHVLSDLHHPHNLSDMHFVGDFDNLAHSIFWTFRLSFPL